MKTFSVCYVFSYKFPNYIRTRTIISALQKIENIKIYQARNSSSNLLRYFQTLWKLIVIRILYNPECYILGFRGYELFWIVRIITIGKPLIFDHLMSPYDSLLNERKTIKQGGGIAKIIYLYEKSILSNSEIVLTDTSVHKEYFQNLFDLPSSKIIAVPVGTDETIFNTGEYPQTGKYPQYFNKSSFNVLFYGYFLPLHGVDIILNAASILREFPICFTLIGGTRQSLNEFHQTIKRLNLENVRHMDWVELDRLPHLIAESDLGFGGPFGYTGQSDRVITSKTFQFLAMAKPVVVGKINFDGGFEDKINSLVVPQGDAQALADAVLWAFQNRDKLKLIGLRGRDLYQSFYSIEKISEVLEKLLCMSFTRMATRDIA